MENEHPTEYLHCVSARLYFSSGDQCLEHWLLHWNIVEVPWIWLRFTESQFHKLYWMMYMMCSVELVCTMSSTRCSMLYKVLPTCKQGTYVIRCTTYITMWRFNQQTASPSRRICCTKRLFYVRCTLYIIMVSLRRVLCIVTAGYRHRSLYFQVAFEPRTGSDLPTISVAQDLGISRSAVGKSFSCPSTPYLKQFLFFFVLTTEYDVPVFLCFAKAWFEEHRECCFSRSSKEYML